MFLKKMKLGSFGLTVAVENRIVDRIRANILYRYFVRPLRNWLAQNSLNSGDAAPSEPTEHRQKVRLVDKKRLDNHNRVEVTQRSPEENAIRERIDNNVWYHSINLGHGVVTPGAFNHNPHISKYHLPDTLKGMRVLDVATFDGFWAFEFERRGAYEVLALDVPSFNEIDLPPLVKVKVPEEDLNRETGIGFGIAKDILKSKVKRELLNVYDLSPERVGRFDMTFCSDLLLHLMNPMKAIQNMHSVVSEYAYIVEPFDPELDIYPNDAIIHYKGGSHKCIWWMFGLKCLENMIRDAGFRKVELVNTFIFGYRGEKEGFWRAVFKAFP
jgi:tRNA (mo5U34)-methyltransferase